MPHEKRSQSRGEEHLSFAGRRALDEQTDSLDVADPFALDFDDDLGDPVDEEEVYVEPDEIIDPDEEGDDEYYSASDGQSAASGGFQAYLAARQSSGQSVPTSLLNTTENDNSFAESDSDTEEIPAYLRRSRRMRRFLIVVIVLLIVLAGVGVYLVMQLFDEAEQTATEQATQQTQEQDVGAIYDDNAGDATSQSTPTTTVPNLYELLGLTQDEAIAKVGRGAEVSSLREITDEADPIKTEVRLSLTDEPVDARTGNPTVYLGLDAEGKTIQVGYSTSTTSLGYGSLSFADAIQSENIVDKTLKAAGIDVEPGSITLPDDPAEYTTYAADGTTKVRESCSFAGDVEIDGVLHEWSSVLSYDYSVANVSGNLSDTVRTIYVYLNQ